jgi:hypothetical protein
MDSRVLWLRIAYWTGAIVDAGAVVAMLSPELNRIFILDGASAFHPAPEYGFAMAYGAALMAGWTVLLLWADRRPTERRGVLVITAIPVVVCLNLSKLILYRGSILQQPFPPAALILPVLLIGLFLFAYFNSRHGDSTTGSGKTATARL